MLKSNPPSSNPVLELPAPPQRTPARQLHNGTPSVPAPRGRKLSTQFAAAVRWLHIYASLLAFTALIFFGVTGITLNHPDWFGADAEHFEEKHGSLNLEWVQVAESEAATPDVEPRVAKLEIVEHLRSNFGVRGAVSEFRIDERECLILFKGPAYAADAIVDRATGDFQLAVTQLGTVALLNDLHKGRDTGSAWSLVIDVVSLATVFISVTGLVLLFYLKRKRVSGIITTVVGTVALIAVIVWLVP